MLKRRGIGLIWFPQAHARKYDFENKGETDFEAETLCTEQIIGLLKTVDAVRTVADFRRDVVSS
jgi:hypothetical protein